MQMSCHRGERGEGGIGGNRRGGIEGGNRGGESVREGGGVGEGSCCFGKYPGVLERYC